MTKTLHEVADAARILALKCTPEAAADQTVEALLRLRRELAATQDRIDWLILERGIGCDGKANRRCKLV